MALQPGAKSSRLQIFFKIDVLKRFAKFIGNHLYQRNLRKMSSCEFCDVQLYRKFKGIPHRFSLLVPEYLLCVTVPFQNNFSEQLLFRTGIFHNSYLQEQPSEVFYKKSCPKTCCNIHRKIPLGL